MPLTTRCAQAILNNYVGSAYLALLTACTSESSMTEVSGTGYARVSLSGLMTIASGTKIIKNSYAIHFPLAESAWGTVTHFALLSSSTDTITNCNVYGTVTPSGGGSGGVVVAANTVPMFKAEDFQISITSS